MFWLGLSCKGVGLSVGLYFLGMFFVTATYHRYFSHRTFKMPRWFQFVMAFMAQLSAQKGVLWWAANHRIHHKHSDQGGDVHSAVREGFWYSHVGWILDHQHDETRFDLIGDFAKYPELRLLNRFHLVPPVLLGVALYLAGGPWLLLYGLFVPLVLLWHGTFTINSLSHIHGSRRFATTDHSRNNWLLALITMGEGWHNNHHHYMSSVRQGFYWWEVDMTYYGLRFLSLFGLVTDMRGVPERVYREAARGAPVLEKKQRSSVPANEDRLAA